IHRRQGYRWRYPCHEVVECWTGGGNEAVADIPGDEPLIEHWADDAKPRGWYRDLLAVSVRENPLDERARFYLAREDFFHQPGGPTSGGATVLARMAERQGLHVEAKHLRQMAWELATTDEERVRAAMR